MPQSNPDALPASPSAVDGIWYKDRFSVNPSPGIQPGVKFYTIGQLSGNAVPPQVAPVGAPVVAAAAGATAFLAGNYFLAYSWLLTAGVETYLSPLSAVVTLAAGQQINVSGIPAFPGGVTAARFYFAPAQNGVTSGFIGQVATNANFSITTPGDGTFGPQQNQGFGTYQIPALLFGLANAQTLVISDTTVGLNSRIFLGVRAGSTVAAAGAFPILVNTVLQVAGAFQVKMVNLGSANSLITDWVIDFEVQN